MDEAGKKLLIIAGEASGDAHGAELVRRLLERDPSLRIDALGGPKMSAAGANVLQDLTHHAVIGAAGLFENLGGLIRAYRTVTHRLGSNRPDAIVLIDFPEFNLMVARHAKQIGVPVIYYVSPQVWAWRTGRIRKIADRVRKMLCFFEFEKDLYEQAGVDVTHVGHPLLDSMADKLAITDRAAVRESLGLPRDGLLIGLVPGSRRKEITHVFPVLLKAARLIRDRVKDVTFAVPKAPGLKPRLLYQVGGRHGVKFELINGRTHDVMFASDLLLICSGTATLEAGILGTPMVATYKADPLSYALFGPLIKPGFFALPNIVAGEEVVPEFYMIDAKPKRIADAALAMMDSGLDAARRRLAVVREKLGQPGASARAADEILKIIMPSTGSTP